MIQSRQIRQMYEGRCRENRDPRAGRLAFLREWYETLGLVPNQFGQPTALMENHRPKLGENRASPDEVSIRQLADALIGHDVVEEFYHPAGGVPWGQMGLLEASMDPGAMLNISTFNLAVSGLVNAQILEGFMQPEFIGLDLVTVVPSKKNGDKWIGVSGIPNASKTATNRLPGESHAAVQFGEAWQDSPATAEQALKVELTNEVVFYDLTNQVLPQAKSVGEHLRYIQEKDIADMILGVTSGYNRNGTSYNTYQTASPWINDHSNPFTDQLDVDDARQLFVGITDPETSKEILVNGVHILCMPARELKFRDALFGSTVQVGTQAAGNFPARWTSTGNNINQVAGGSISLTPLSSIWYNRATAADGLNLSAANAKEYWWMGDYKKAFCWTENWPLTLWSANATELTMKDKGLIAVHGANYRGVAWPKEPRYVVRNKN